jgi:hypothetical protein
VNLPGFFAELRQRNVPGVGPIRSDPAFQQLLTTTELSDQRSSTLQLFLPHEFLGV